MRAVPAGAVPQTPVFRQRRCGTQSPPGSVGVAGPRSFLACAHRAVLAFLLELLADSLALEIRQVVHEKLALEMIHLVLDADGQHIVVVALEKLAVPVLRT